MDETTTLQIEAKLERERTNIALLEQNLEKYNGLTLNASNILKSFEQRLLKVICCCSAMYMPNTCHILNTF